MEISKRILFQRTLFIAFWIKATFQFVAEEIMPFMEALAPTVNLLFDAVIVAIGCAVLKRRADKIILAIFVVYSFYITYVCNGLSLLFYINGLRDFISYMFILPIFHYFFEDEERKKDFVDKLDKSLIVFLCLQMLCVTWQFLKYGIGDHGGGSLGNWNSGIISTLIYITSFYLMEKRFDKQNFFASLVKNKFFVIALFPTFLNETKISFIFLVLYFLLLLPIDRKAFMRILAMVPVMVVLFYGLIVMYLHFTGEKASAMFSMEYYTEMYLLNDESADYAVWLMDNDDTMEDVPRFSKLLLLEDVNEEKPGHIMRGFGVGQFKGGTLIDVSKFYKEYEWLMVGSIPYLFHLLIQIGLIGVILFVAFWVYEIGWKRKGFRRNNNIQLYIISVILLILFYNDSLRDTFMTFILLFILEMSFTPKTEAIEEDADDEDKIIA